MRNVARMAGTDETLFVQPGFSAWFAAINAVSA